MTAGERFQEGQLVGRYRIVQLIGEGGMGAVYEAIHPGLKKRVAVKVLLPRIAESAEARLRFLREGEAASRINHPNVVSVFDVGEDNGVPYLVMEYLEGRSLGELLAGRSALELADAAALALPIMAAVATGHDCGVVHRDLKPQNIFLAQGRWGEPIPKVLDFGVSKLIDHDGPPVTRTETMLGTACYMSPEQARGARNVDARSDQFTLGLIVYEMLTGRRAYRGDNDLEILYNAASGTIQPAQELRAGLPDEVYGLLGRMLAVAPSDRFPGLRDAARILLPFASEKTRTALARDFDAVVQASNVEAPVGSSGTAVFPVIADGNDDTTLRRAAVQSQRTERTHGRSRGRVALVAAALGSAAVAVVVLLALRAGRHESERQAPVSPARAAVDPASLAAPVPAARSAPAASASAVLVAPAPSTAPEEPGRPEELEEARKPQNPGEPADRAAPFEIRAFPPEAELVLDGRQPLVGRLQLVLPLAGASHELRVSAAGYDSKTVQFGVDQPPPAEIHLARTAAHAPRAATKKAPRPAGRIVKRGTNDALIIK